MDSRGKRKMKQVMKYNHILSKFPNITTPYVADFLFKYTAIYTKVPSLTAFGNFLEIK